VPLVSISPSLDIGYHINTEYNTIHSRQRTCAFEILPTHVSWTGKNDTWLLY
jgi:hypothetical protein